MRPIADDVTLNWPRFDENLEGIIDDLGRPPTQKRGEFTLECKREAAWPMQPAFDYPARSPKKDFSIISVLW